jgi:[protein-PII] uridylyltransferase
LQGDRNLLDYEAQEHLAAQPFAQLEASDADAPPVTARDWMRGYYLEARQTFNEARRAMDLWERTGGNLLDNFHDWRTRLSNSDFTVSRERILLRNQSRLETEPALVFRLLEFIARHGIPPAAETERRLEAARESLARYCAEPHPLWPALKTILALPFAALALRTLEATGLLTVVLPEWSSIEGQAVVDAAHAYTLDEQTLFAIEQWNALRGATDAPSKRYAELLDEIDEPALLVFALLFHNMGSGEATLGYARSAMARVQLPESDRELVEALLDTNASLLDATSGRDLDDPATARLLAARVGTIERLKQLTILDYANLSVLKPDAMWTWRFDQLWRLYTVARRELTRELETDRIADVPPELGAHPEFLRGFPVRYLRVYPPREIAAHIHLYELSRPTGVAVRLDRLDSAYRLTVVARDMPALFASLAGAISSFGLDILKAEAFSNANGIILDTFVFADPRRTLELNPPEADRLQDLVRRVALGKTDAKRLLRNRPPVDPKRRTAPATVEFDSEACASATLVQIDAEDRPGLLYSLASVLAATACNIDVVLIDTKGRRAIDVFYVAHAGQKLGEELQRSLREKLLAVC